MQSLRLASLLHKEVIVPLLIILILNVLVHAVRFGTDILLGFTLVRRHEVLVLLRLFEGHAISITIQDALPSFGELRLLVQLWWWQRTQL